MVKQKQKSGTQTQQKSSVRRWVVIPCHGKQKTKDQSSLILCKNCKGYCCSHGSGKATNLTKGQKIVCSICGTRFYDI